MLEIIDLKCNHQKRPFGITGMPVFSWKILSTEENTFQQAFQLKIYHSDQLVYDSGRVETRQLVEIAPEGFSVKSSQEYVWKIQVWDNHKDVALEQDCFEAAPERFDAKWIEPSIPGVKYEKPINIIASIVLKAKPKLPPEERLLPVTLLRKEFTVKVGLVKARAYATARGTYGIQFNGKTPDERMLAPEFTAYHKYLCYQTYDITRLLQTGKNACGVMLADGWWAGRIGMGGECGQYGLSRAFLLQVELTYEDGTQETVISDENFRCSADGTIRYSDIFIGEKQDHNYQEKVEGYSLPGFMDHSWSGVSIANYGYDNLRPQIGEPVMKIKEIKPIKLLRTPKGENVIDFGQNFAGFVRFQVNAPKGTVIRLEHSEVLDEQGNYLNNIIGVNKDQTDIFVCAGTGNEVFEPQFTFHGFRYVRVTGMEHINLNDICGIAISSAMENLAEFECSNEMVNKLCSNTRWSQYSNMISIPTDCPQRERAGWTADIQVFAPTASYHQDMNMFLTRWIENVAAEQFEDGQIPIVVPYSYSYQYLATKFFKSDSAAGWSEACIVIPYTLYKMYGNKTILEQHYSMMTRWMDYVQNQAANFHSKIFEKKKKKSPQEIENHKFIWDTKSYYGDWLAPSVSKKGGAAGAKITREITATYYYAYSATLMSEIATVLGREEESLKYIQLREKIMKAIDEIYFDQEGHINPDLQGSYVLALGLDLVPKDKVSQAVGRLKQLIERNEYRLDTGFLSTPLLLDVLMKYGLKDEAYRILYQEKSPSWFYEIKNGATTIWETWSNITPEGKVSNDSYNHYALGCVCDWIYRNISGIQNQSVGYQKIRIEPQPDETMSWAKSSYKSIYGLIESSWKKQDNKFLLHVKIPCNTSATVVLPDGKQHEVGSGSYEFVCK